MHPLIDTFPPFSRAKSSHRRVADILPILRVRDAHENRAEETVAPREFSSESKIVEFNSTRPYLLRVFEVIQVRYSGRDGAPARVSRRTMGAVSTPTVCSRYSCLRGRRITQVKIKT